MKRTFEAEQNKYLVSMPSEAQLHGTEVQNHKEEQMKLLVCLCVCVYVYACDLLNFPCDDVTQATTAKQRIELQQSNSNMTFWRYEEQSIRQEIETAKNVRED